VRPYLKNIQYRKRAGRVAQELDHQPSKHEAWVQTPIPQIKKKKKAVTASTVWCHCLDLYYSTSSSIITAVQMPEKWKK
jgi:hypothetical protein